MAKKLFIFTDGGARGNPGPAAIGFVVKDSRGRLLVARGENIGQATNNVAEYQAVLKALRWLKENLGNTFDCFDFYLDSNLVVNQLNGFFKIKTSHLRQLVIAVRAAEQALGGQVFYHFIPRQKNKEADNLVNQALDKKDP